MNKLLKHLTFLQEKNAVSMSNIIKTNSIQKTLESVYEFIKTTRPEFKIKTISHHPDIFCLSPQEEEKIISVDEIRNLKKWHYTTSLSEKDKFCIILHPEKMTVQAANACLKLLEDYQENRFFFLISKNISVILPTLLSRCNLIYDEDNLANADLESYDFFLKNIDTKNIEAISEYFSENEQSLVENFILRMFNAVLKNQLNFTQKTNINFNLKTLNTLNKNSLSKNVNKFYKIIDIINQSSSFEYKHIAILIIEEIYA